MLFGLFLTIPLQQLKRAFLNIQFLGANTIINFIWTPVMAWGLGSIFLADYPALWIGFIMLMVTPCTDWRSEEHTSELQSRGHLVCRLLLEKKKKTYLR